MFNQKKSLIIDQSGKRCGYAVLYGTELVDHGDLISRQKTSTLRLVQFQQDIYELAKDYLVQEVVFEKIQYFKLPTPETIEPLGHASGICKAAAEILGLPWYKVAPPTWKSACGVKGRDKAQQKLSARKIACQRWGLNDSEISSNDHSDALCIAAYWVVLCDEGRS